MRTKTKKPSKNCVCGNKERDHRFCPNCSEYRMVFLLKDETSPYKILKPDGSKVNPAAWSFLKEDKLPLSKQISKMLERAKSFRCYRESRKIQIYNRSGTLVHEELL